MPLLDRADSVLVVEEGPERSGTTDPRDLGFRVAVATDATACVGEIEYAGGLARMAGAGVERGHVKGVTFEWLRTVEDAIAVVGAARERFGLRAPWLR